jgi:hypothetical protein
MYPALVNCSPATRAKQLTVALHWDRSLPKQSGNALGLTDCLFRAGERSSTIAAYWLVRQRAAEYQLLVEQAEFLESLVPVALDRRHEPSGATDMLRLVSQKMAAKAASNEAMLALVEAQYALALKIGAVADAAWPLASTVPHSGGYELRLGDVPPAMVESPAGQRLVSAVPELGQSVLQRAAAVVEADAMRVAVADRYRTGATTIDEALGAVTVQTERTVAFLDTLTQYNRAIADYAILVLPSNIAADKLAASLVIKP